MQVPALSPKLQGPPPLRLLPPIMRGASTHRDLRSSLFTSSVALHSRYPVVSCDLLQHEIRFHQITTPQAGWFRGESDQPLESQHSNPAWRCGYFAGNIVHQRSGTKHRISRELISVFENPGFLPRHPHPHQENMGRVRGDVSQDFLIVFTCVVEIKVSVTRTKLKSHIFLSKFHGRSLGYTRFRA